MKRILLIAALLLAPIITDAQRTSRGESQIAFSGGTTLSHWGGEVYYGQYLLRGFWFGALGFHNRIEIDAPSGETVFFPRLQLRGGYLFRLLSSYKRSVCLYGGADAFIGMEMLDLYGTLSDSTLQSFYNSGFHDYQFIYGAAPRLELELFLFPTVALILQGRAPLCFGSPFPVLGWELSAGVKVNF